MRKRKSSKGAGVLFLLALLLLLHFSTGLLNDSFSDYQPRSAEVFVEIAGDVEDPGVYGFLRAPDLSKLVDAAGGFIGSGSPDISRNQGVFLTGEKVVITCTAQEAAVDKSRMSPFYRLTLGIPISINTDTAVGLTAVPGIGPKTAEAIVAARKRNGGFKALEDLISIQGISNSLFARISPCLTL